MVSHANERLLVQRDSLVCEPTKSAEHEERPVVPAHTDILYGLVDDLRFSCSTMKLLAGGFHGRVGESGLNSRVCASCVVRTVIDGVVARGSHV